MARPHADREAEANSTLTAPAIERGAAATPDPLRTAQRRRKLRDAAALLPVLGVILLVSPVVSAFTHRSNDAGLPVAVVYIFGVWLALIGLAFWLARPLATRDED